MKVFWAIGVDWDIISKQGYVLLRLLLVEAAGQRTLVAFDRFRGVA